MRHGFYRSRLGASIIQSHSSGDIPQITTRQAGYEGEPGIWPFAMTMIGQTSPGGLMGSEVALNGATSGGAWGALDEMGLDDLALGISFTATSN
jgi:hypothetical protein